MTTSSIASSSRSSTALVMMDTRPAQIAADSPASNLDYPQLAFELNRGYACRHGYDLLYLRMQSATCEHELLGDGEVATHHAGGEVAALASALAASRPPRGARPRAAKGGGGARGGEVGVGSAVARAWQLALRERSKGGGAR